MTDPVSNDEPAPPWVIDAVQAIIVHAVDNDSDEVADLLQRIGECGVHVMFGACATFAEAIAYMSGIREAEKRAPGGHLALEVQDGVPDNDPGLFAARFVTCYANRDLATAHALYAAAWNAGQEHWADCILSLVAMVGAAGRDKLARNKAERNPQEKP